MSTVQKSETEPSSEGQVKGGLKPLWNPVRFSGRLKFRKKPSTVADDTLETKPHFENRLDPYALKSPLHVKIKSSILDHPQSSRFGCSCCGNRNQFHNYCQHTSLHGFRYITEKHRNFSER